MFKEQTGGLRSRVFFFLLRRTALDAVWFFSFEGVEPQSALENENDQNNLGSAPSEFARYFIFLHLHVQSCVRLAGGHIFSDQEGT